MFGGTTFDWQSFTSLSLKLWTIFILVLLLAWFPSTLWVIFGEHDLTSCPLPLLRWCPSRGPLRKGCCLFVIAEKSSLDFCLLLAVLMKLDSNPPPNKNCFSLKNISPFSWRNCFVFLGSQVISFRTLKTLLLRNIVKSLTQQHYSLV